MQTCVTQPLDYAPLPFFELLKWLKIEKFTVFINYDDLIDAERIVYANNDC